MSKNLVDNANRRNKMPTTANTTMKAITPQTLSLIGFAASEWAGERINGSRHRSRYRQLIAAGLELHTNADLYAAAPRLEAALRQVINHARRAVR